MKLSNLLRSCLLLVLLLLIVGGLIYLNSRLAWPWWRGAIIVGSLFAVVAVVVLGRRYLKYRRERRFIARILHRGEVVDQRLKHQQFSVRWQALSTAIRAPSFTQHGKPIQQLPWFLFMGAGGSGKSTALVHAGGNPLLPDGNAIDHIAPTQACDWWLFDQCVIVELAGEAIAAADQQASQRKEHLWQQFLRKVVTRRQPLPLAGVVISLSVDTLLHTRPERLAEDGRTMAHCLSSLMRKVGQQLPCYLMLTQCDKLTGFTALCSLLSAAEQQQTMGYLRSDDHKNTLPATFIEQALASLTKRLTRLNSVLWYRRQTAQLDSARLIFALQDLGAALKVFANAAFSDTSYYVSPLLSGLFCTGHIPAPATQATDSSAVKKTEQSTHDLQGSQRPTTAAFLRQFFTTLLPAKPHQAKPLPEFLIYRARRSHWLLSASLAGLLALVLFFSHVYDKGQQQLARLQRSVDALEQLQQRDLTEQIRTLNTLRRAILAMDSPLQQVLFPPLAQGKQQAIRHYLDYFQSNILELVDRHMAEQMRHGKRANIDVVEALVHMHWRLNAIDNLLTHKNHNLDTKATKDSSASRRLYGLEGEFQHIFSKLFAGYSQWVNDPNRLIILKGQVQDRLSRIINHKDSVFWFIDWVSDRVPDIDVNSFWNLHAANADATVLPGAYTQAGKKLIEALLHDAERFGELPASRAKAFYDYYIREYIYHWQRFLTDFPNSASSFSLAEKRLIALEMAALDNPYTRLVRKAAKELAGIDQLATIPPLGFQALHLLDATLQYHEVVQKDSGMLEKGEAIISETLMLLKNQRSESFHTIKECSRYLADYLDAMSTMLHELDSKTTALHYIAQIFTEQNSEFPAVKAHNAVSKMNRLLNTQQDLFAVHKLIQGMHQFLIKLEMRLAAYQLNEDWDSNVYGALRYIAPNQHYERLFGEGGLMDRFLSGPMKPFIIRRRDGWKKKGVMGFTMPLTSEFMHFVEASHGARFADLAEYPVQLTGLPCDLNGEATQWPLSVELTLESATGQQQLISYNYAKSKRFIWKPKECGTTRLRIHFKSFSLLKEYRGESGFIDFLSAFQSGSVDFRPQDFPAFKKVLESYNIRHISVKFKFDNISRLLRRASGKKLKIPTTITHCANE